MLKIPCSHELPRHGVTFPETGVYCRISPRPYVANSYLVFCGLWVSNVIDENIIYHIFLNYCYEYCK